MPALSLYAKFRGQRVRVQARDMDPVRRVAAILYGFTSTDLPEPEAAMWALRRAAAWVKAMRLEAGDLKAPIGGR